MSFKELFSVLLCALLIASSGCTGRDEAATSDSVAARPQPFAELYQKHGEVTLQQPDSAPIVRISGIDRGLGGRILLGDVSEGNVKVFGPDGTLLRIIGRKGGGPGEFSAPRYPRFGPGGRIFVGDAQSSRIQSFDSAGAVLGSISLPDAGILQGMQPLANGNILVLASSELRESVLLEVDPAGQTVREYLRISRVRPTGQREHVLWRNINAFSLDVDGDTAYVSNAVSDTLWSVHLGTGREHRTRLVMPGYVGPTPPAELPDNVAAMLDWSRAFHTASTLTAERGTVLLPYVRGVLNKGDPMLLATRTPGGLSVSADAPPIIGGGDGMLIGIMNPDEAEIRLGLFSYKARR